MHKNSCIAPAGNTNAFAPEINIIILIVITGVLM